MPNARSRLLRQILAIAILTGCAAPSTPDVTLSPRRAPFDLIVRGGLVLDGTGRPAYRADVGVAGSRIARIGDLSRDSATTVLDASGLVVAPGLHLHAE